MEDEGERREREDDRYGMRGEGKRRWKEGKEKKEKVGDIKRGRRRDARIKERKIIKDREVEE